MSALSPRDCVELDLAKERNKRLAYINGDIPVSFEHASFLQKSNLGGNSLAANLPSTSLLHGPPISWPSHYQNNLGRLNFDIPHHYSNPSQEIFAQNMSLIGNHPAKQIVILPIPCVVLDGTFPLQPPELAATLQLPSPTAAQNIPKEAAVVEAEPKATTKATESTEKHKVPTTHKPSSPTLVRTQAEIYKSSWPSPIKVSAVLDPRSSVNWISERRLLNLKALLPRVPVSMVQYHEYEGHCLQGDATVTIIWKGTRQMTFSDIFYIASGSETPLELVFGKCSIGKFGKTVDIGRSTKEKDHKSEQLSEAHKS